MIVPTRAKGIRKIMKNGKLIILFLLVSCVRKTTFERILITNSNKEFWIEEKKEKNNNWIYMGNQWIFYRDGSAKCLIALNPEKKGTPIINVEGPSDYSWSYNVRDSILNVGPGVKYKIKRYNLDSIFMNTQNGGYFLLIHKHW